MKQYLVFDLGGTSIKYALISETAEILEHGKTDAVTDSLDHLLDLLGSVGRTYEGRYEGAAVSMPGRISTAKGIAFTGGAYRFIRDIPIADLLEKRLGVPVTIANDGKCAANAEAWNGALSGIQNGAVIILGTGTGGGILLNGKIWMGTSGGGGELSHLVTDINAFSEAGFSLKNNIEAMWVGHASATGLIGKYAIRKNQPFLGNSYDGISLFEAYDAGDPDAWAALEDFGLKTAAGIYSIQSVLDLERYAVGGGISARREVTDMIRVKVNELFGRSANLPFMAPEIVPCRYGNDANLIGALRFHLDRITQ
ncbi:MAG: ROK family protein [Solobacterium sp.]|nr:ROK family protein [Solobacterium sp.]